MVSQNKLGIYAYVKICGYQLFIFLANKIQLQIFLSRSLQENTKGQLSPAIFKKIIRTFDFEPAIYLFASYLNYQVENYISWFRDPKASIIDAFGIVWTNKKFYAFSLIGPTLDAVVVDPILVPFDATNAGRLQLPLQLPINLKSLFWHGTNKRYTHYNQRWDCELFDYQGNNPKQKNSRQDCRNYQRVVET